MPNFTFAHIEGAIARADQVEMRAIVASYADMIDEDVTSLEKRKLLVCAVAENPNFVENLGEFIRSIKIFHSDDELELIFNASIEQVGTNAYYIEEVVSTLADDDFLSPKNRDNITLKLLDINALEVEKLLEILRYNLGDKESKIYVKVAEHPRALNNEDINTSLIEIASSNKETVSSDVISVILSKPTVPQAVLDLAAESITDDFYSIYQFISDFFSRPRGEPEQLVFLSCFEKLERKSDITAVAMMFNKLNTNRVLLRAVDITPADFITKELLSTRTPRDVVKALISKSTILTYIDYVNYCALRPDVKDKVSLEPEVIATLIERSERQEMFELVSKPGALSEAQMISIINLGQRYDLIVQRLLEMSPTLSEQALLAVNNQGELSDGTRELLIYRATSSKVLSRICERQKCSYDNLLVIVSKSKAIPLVEQIIVLREVFRSNNASPDLLPVLTEDNAEALKELYIDSLHGLKDRDERAKVVIKILSGESSPTDLITLAYSVYNDISNRFDVQIASLFFEHDRTSAEILRNLVDDFQIIEDPEPVEILIAQGQLSRALVHPNADRELKLLVCGSKYASPLILKEAIELIPDGYEDDFSQIILDNPNTDSSVVDCLQRKLVLNPLSNTYLDFEMLESLLLSPKASIDTIMQALETMHELDDDVAPEKKAELQYIIPSLLGREDIDVTLVKLLAAVCIDENHRCHIERKILELGSVNDDAHSALFYLIDLPIFRGYKFNSKIACSALSIDPDIRSDLLQKIYSSCIDIENYSSDENVRQSVNKLLSCKNISEDMLLELVVHINDTEVLKECAKNRACTVNVIAEMYATHGMRAIEALLKSDLTPLETLQEITEEASLSQLRLIKSHRNTDSELRSYVELREQEEISRLRSGVTPIARVIGGADRFTGAERILSIIGREGLSREDTRIVESIKSSGDTEALDALRKARRGKRNSIF